MRQMHRPWMRNLMRLRWTILLLPLIACSTGGAAPETADPGLAPALRLLAPARATRLHTISQRQGPIIPSPDGRYLVALHEYPLPGVEGTLPVGIRLYNADGVFLRDLTFGKFYRVDEVAWSPGGQALYFRADPSLESHPGGGLWKCDLSSGTIYRPRLPGLIPAKLEPDLSSIEQGQIPIWSPRGESYLVEETQRLAKDTFRNVIYRVDLRSGRKRPLAEGSGPVWSPDGRWIAYVRSQVQDGKSTNEWWVMTRDGSGKRPVLTERYLDLQARLRAQDTAFADVPAAWLGPTGTILIAGSLTRETPTAASTGVWRVGRTVELVPLPKLRLMAAAADGRHFYFESCPKPGTFITYCVTREGRR